MMVILLGLVSNLEKLALRFESHHESE